MCIQRHERLLSLWYRGGHLWDDAPTSRMQEWTGRRDSLGTCAASLQLEKSLVGARGWPSRHEDFA